MFDTGGCKMLSSVLENRKGAIRNYVARARATLKEQRGERGGIRDVVDAPRQECA